MTNPVVSNTSVDVKTLNHSLNNAAAGVDNPQPAEPDSSQVVQHIIMLHTLAERAVAAGKAPADGLLVISTFREDMMPVNRHFAIGDRLGMLRTIHELYNERNVYAPLVIMKPGSLTSNAKGGEEDIAAVLGLCVDGDSDHGYAAPVPPVEANYVVESSAGNLQHSILLSEALSLEHTYAIAKHTAQSLKRMTKADNADVLSCVWRVPGTLNFPNRAKLARGRPEAPQAVRIVKPWDGGLTDWGDLRVALKDHFSAHPLTPKVPRPPKSTWNNDPALVRKLMIRARNEGWFDKSNPDYRRNYVWAGKALSYDLGDEHGLPIFKDVVCWNGDRANQGRAVDEVELEVRWRDVSNLREGVNPISLGTIKRTLEEDYGWPQSSMLTEKKHSAAEMFAGLDAAMAAQPAAPDTPAPSGAVSLAGRDAAITKAGKPVLATVPTLPPPQGCPQLPSNASVRGLYAELNRAIPGMLADPATHTEALAFLALVHPETFIAVAAMVPAIDANAIKLRADGLHCEIDRSFKTTFTDWIRNPKGEPDTRNSDNIKVFLTRIRAEVRYNAFLEQAQARKSPNDPWQELDDNVVRDLHMTARNSAHQFYVGKDLLWDTLTALAHQREEDPVLDHLTELQGRWDGVLRLDGWIPKVCGTPHDAYHIAVGRNIIGGLVRRLRHPGAKHDAMAVFQGAQGGGKSSMVKLLAIRPEWFSEATVLGEESKELILQLAGRTVLEIAEMGQRSTASINDIKNMLSRTEDCDRLSYDRALTRRMRRSIYVGTTNDTSPLNDPTGGRRFFPIKCVGPLDLEWLKANVDQLYAEACVLESHGHEFQLPPDLWDKAAEHQEAARHKDDMEIALREHFEAGIRLPMKNDKGIPIPGTEIDTTNAFITAGDLTELAKLSGWPGNNKNRTLTMKALGFADPTEDRPYVDGKQCRIWLRGEYIKAVRYVVRKDITTGLARITLMKP